MSLIDKPGKPENVKPKEIWADNVLMTWEAPKDDGGVPIKNYIVQYKNVSKRGQDWVKAGMIYLLPGLTLLSGILNTSLFLSSRPNLIQ